MKQYLQIAAFLIISTFAKYSEASQFTPMLHSPVDTNMHWDTLNNYRYVNIAPTEWVRFQNLADRLYLRTEFDNLYSSCQVVWQIRCTDTVDATTFTHRVLQQGVYQLSGSEYASWPKSVPWLFDFMAAKDFISVTITD